MRLLELDEKKEMALNIYREIDTLCKKHGINYYIAYGTLIGACRHGGFIPWDDDIDLWIPANDYLRLLKVLEAASKYHLLNNMMNANWPRVFSKLQYPGTHVIDLRKNAPKLERGLAVDLFPLFNIDNPDRAFETGRKIIRRLNGFAALDGKSDASRIHQKLIISEAIMNRHIGKDVKYWQEQYWSINTNHPTQYVSYLGSKYGRIDIHEAELFANSVNVSFEGMNCPAPAGYDSILKKIYGDYMSLPPLEKRVSVHDVDVYMED